MDESEGELNLESSEALAEAREKDEFVKEVVDMIKNGEASFIFHTVGSRGLEDVMQEGFNEQTLQSFASAPYKTGGWSSEWSTMNEYFPKSEFERLGITEYIFGSSHPYDYNKDLKKPTIGQRHIKFTHSQEIIDQFNRKGFDAKTFCIPEAHFKKLFGDDKTDGIIRKYPGVVREILFQLAPDIMRSQEKSTLDNNGTILHKVQNRRRVFVSIREALGSSIWGVNLSGPESFRRQEHLKRERINAVPERVLEYEVKE